jgi:membrane fusion protein, multidrug efflux system
MSEKVLKIVPAPEARTSPETKAGRSPKRSWLERLGRKRLRMILLVVLPVFAVIIGLGIYLSGGRYISTDNAYVGAQKVLITPDISGKITHVAVREGQHVNPGDELFTLDREPFALALQQAKAKLDTARSDFDKLKSNLKSLNTLADLAGKNVELKQHDVDRKSKLVSSQSGSPADLDAAQVAVVTAQLQAEYAVQQR